jgi:hypothetical protein
LPPKPIAVRYSDECVLDEDTGVPRGLGFGMSRRRFDRSAASVERVAFDRSFIASRGHG